MKFEFADDDGSTVDGHEAACPYDPNQTVLPRRMRLKAKWKGKLGWKPTGNMIGPGKMKNERTGEVMSIPLQAEERYIVRVGKRKGKNIYRYTVVE